MYILLRPFSCKISKENLENIKCKCIFCLALFYVQKCKYSIYDNFIVTGTQDSVAALGYLIKVVPDILSGIHSSWWWHSSWISASASVKALLQETMKFHKPQTPPVYHTQICTGPVK